MRFRIYRTEADVLVENNGVIYNCGGIEWNSFINDDHLLDKLIALTNRHQNRSSLTSPVAPIDKQEIWASGVTYMKSKEARVEESKVGGGGSFYDKVYNAERPELFFKATAQRTVGHQQPVHIRRDSDWNVPEPELTLLISASGKILGYTIGNDMSSRSIEGENPLYLPQAKVYEKCAAIGPCILVQDKPLDENTIIEMEIHRNKNIVFEGSVKINQMKRKHEELVTYLFRECKFPNGCFLMTGTGMVPPNDFTLQVGDEVKITIEPIGTLINTVSSESRNDR